MNSGGRIVQYFIWATVGLVMASIGSVFVSMLLHPPAKPLPVYGQVPAFTLTNELGQAVSLADLKGHVWVGDIIFTRCPGSCLEMTRKMKAIQQQLPLNSSVKLVSITVDPAFDTAPVLQAYATRFKADPAKWHFLTGPKQTIYDLATKGLKLAVQDNSTTNVDEMYIHSTRLVVVDQAGQLRAVGFDGTEPDVVPGVLRAVDQLVREQ